MPIYEYECTNCNKKLEFFQKISEPLKTACPECKGETLKKLISAAGFRLKGSGWYETDFKSSEHKKNISRQDSETVNAVQSESSDHHQPKAEPTTTVSQAATLKANKEQASATPKKLTKTSSETGNL